MPLVICKYAPSLRVAEHEEWMPFREALRSIVAEEMNPTDPEHLTPDHVEVHLDRDQTTLNALPLKVWVFADMNESRSSQKVRDDIRDGLIERLSPLMRERIEFDVWLFLGYTSYRTAWGGPP